MTKKLDAPFELEAPIPGHVPDRVIEELRSAYRIAKDYASAYGDAAKTQAEKYEIAPGALKKYISALEGDKLDEAGKEADDINRLIEQHGAA